MKMLLAAITVWVLAIFGTPAMADPTVSTGAPTKTIHAAIRLHDGRPARLDLSPQAISTTEVGGHTTAEQLRPLHIRPTDVDF